MEYIYPLKTDGKATATLESVRHRGDHQVAARACRTSTARRTPSPSRRQTDKEVTVIFERNQGLLDKDFQMFYQLGDKDIGLTAMTHRPIAKEGGYFMALMTPKVEMKKEYQMPRDVVLVLDTSGSMRENGKIDQAKKALNYCLNSLDKNDRFALINFATTVNRYKDGLLEASSDQIGQAKKWVDNLDATGGTAINDALESRLGPAAVEGRGPHLPGRLLHRRRADHRRNQPRQDPEEHHRQEHGQHAHLHLRRRRRRQRRASSTSLAEGTRAVSTYVRPQEDIEAKVSAMYSKISHPVLTNLKLAATGDVSLQRGLSAAAAGPVPRTAARGAGPIHRQAGRRH